MSTRPEPAGYVTVQGYIFDGVEYDPTTGANPAYEGDSATTIEFKPAVSYVVDAAVHALVLPGTYPGQLAAADDPGGAYFAGYLLDAEGNQGVRLPVSGQPDQWGWNATVTQSNGTVKTFSLPQPLTAGTVYDLDELLPVAATPGTPTVIGPSPIVDYDFTEGTAGTGITSTQTGSGTSGDPYEVTVSVDPDLLTNPVQDSQVAGFVDDSGSATRGALDGLYASTSALASKANASDLTAETTRAEAAESANATAISDETTRAEAAESANATAASDAQATANAALPKGGGTMTGSLILDAASAAETNSLVAASMEDVNSAVAGAVVAVPTSTGALDLSGHTALNQTFELAAFTGNVTFDASAKKPAHLSGVTTKWRIIVKQPASGTTTNTFTISNAVWLTGTATPASTGASALTVYDFIDDGTTVFVSALAADISSVQASKVDQALTFNASAGGQTTVTLPAGFGALLITGTIETELRYSALLCLDVGVLVLMAYGHTAGTGSAPLLNTTTNASSGSAGVPAFSSSGTTLTITAPTDNGATGTVAVFRGHS